MLAEKSQKNENEDMNKIESRKVDSALAENFFAKETLGG